MTTTLWRRDDNWVGSEIDEAFVMVNIETGTYVALNASASAIWQAMADPVEQAGIEAALQQVYDVSPQDCHRAVSDVLAEMQRLKMASPD